MSDHIRPASFGTIPTSARPLTAEGDVVAGVLYTALCELLRDLDETQAITVVDPKVRALAESSLKLYRARE